MKKTFLNRVITGMLAATMLIGVTGCGGNEAGNEVVDEATEAVTEAVAEDATGAQASADDQSLQLVLDNGQFILGLDASFKPMGYTDENDEIVGFDIDVAQEVCNRLGVELVKQPINWDTKEEDLNAGRIDCIWNGMSVNPERAESMNLSEPYMKNSMVFVVPADSEAQSMADLSEAIIGVQNGSTAQTILESSDIASTISTQALATNVEALQQMELGLVNSVFLDSIVAEYEITSAQKDYRILPDGLEEEEYAIGFRKNDQALRDEVQRILSEMKADGSLGEISTKWFGSDVTTVQ